MEKPHPLVLQDFTAPDFDPEQMGAGFWYEQYLQQREENQRLYQKLSQLQVEVEQLKEGLRKLSHRNSDNSSQPPSADAYTKKSKAIKQRQKKQRPKDGQEGKTRNGVACVDHAIELNLEHCSHASAANRRVGGQTVEV